jgi:RNA polymerase sigma factor (sigma-70 family)
VCWVAASVLEAHAIAVAGSHDRTAIRRIPQQVTALLAHTAELTEEPDEEFAEILLRLRFISLYHLIELGDSAPQAIAVGEALSTDLERVLGPDDPDTLNVFNSLAAAYLAAGRVADAIPLFEQTLIARQMQLGPDDPDTLTSQNNLASAYQDAGRVGEAIQLYELNLAERDRLLGEDHPGTLVAQGNLATAYLAAGRVDEAIPLLEQTLASRERVLGPGHPDTRTSRRNLAKAYQDAGRDAEAIPLLEQAPAARPRVQRPDAPRIRAARSKAPADAAANAPPADSARPVLPAGVRRPPADSARPVLPRGVRRPPADSARPARPTGAPGPQDQLPGRPAPARTAAEPLTDAEYDREVLAVLAAGDPAAIAMAYDRYAAGLYGYCHWMLHDAAAAASSVQDTFILAGATLGELPAPVKLRPWLFALARNDCRRRIRPLSAVSDEADPATEQADPDQPADGARAADGARPADGARAADGSRPADDAGQPAVVMAGPNDVTVRITPISRLAPPPPDLGESTTQFRALKEPADPPREPADPLRHLGDPTVLFSSASAGSADAFRDLGPPTVRFTPVSGPADAFRDLGDVADKTVQFSVVGALADATMQFRVIPETAEVADDIADFSGYLGQDEMRSLIRSVLDDMKPREREVVELSFTHDLFDNDLAIVLGLSVSKADALAQRTRGRLEKSLAALRTALAGRQACPVMGELLADWDGQLTEQTRDLVAWHLETCQICVNQTRGALRPTVLSGLVPLPPLPPELRAKVLRLCSSTTEDAVAYRRRVVRHADSTWAGISARAVQWMSWDSIRANPGPAIAAAAVALWLAGAVIVTLLTFAGSPAAHAQTNPPAGSATTNAQAAPASARTLVSPAADPTTAAASTRARVSPSPALTQPAAAYVPSQSQPPPSVSPSHSPSPKPSKSPKSSPSASSSKSPSPSASASPSASHSPSSSPSPTA